MGVQRELKDFYEDTIRLAENYLKKNLGAVEMAPNELSSADRCAKFFSLNTTVYDRSVEIIIGLPHNFPDTFPIIEIGKNSFASIYPIPHLDSDRVLCVFDPETSLPNADDPQGVISTVIGKAWDIIEAGISGSNKADYLDEFDAYWDQNVTGIALSSVDFITEPKEIEFFKYELPNGRVYNMFVDSRIDGIHWAVNLGCVVPSGWKKALYLPMDSIGNPPYPKTNRQLLQRLNKTNQMSCVAALVGYLNKNPRPSTVLFSITHNRGNIIGAWQHKPIKKLMKGFRVGTRNARIELLADNGTLALNTFGVIRVDQQRLFTRGGEGLGPIHPKSIAVLGCGSIGGFLAQGLVERGLRRLLLADPDILKFENIARHLCGASEVAQLKVTAVRRRLVSDFPYIECNAYAQDVTEILSSDPEGLDGYDLTIVAIGRLPIERRMNQLLLQGTLKGPMLFIWVEPYLAAGHAIWVEPNQSGCFECLFDGNFQFLNPVLEDPSQYIEREAGCQTSYVPYGVTDIRRFINEVLVFIEDGMTGRLKSNTLFTWLGDLSAQRALLHKTVGKWAGANSYTTRRIPISTIGTCGKCGL